jgi:hypothetical protein
MRAQTIWQKCGPSELMFLGRRGNSENVIEVVNDLAKPDSYLATYQKVLICSSA